MATEIKFGTPRKIEPPKDARSRSNPAEPIVRDLQGKEGWFRFDFPDEKTATTARAQLLRAGKSVGVKVRTKTPNDDKGKPVATAVAVTVETPPTRDEILAPSDSGTGTAKNAG